MPTIPTTMRAAAEFGGPEVLKLHRLPVAAPAAVLNSDRYRRLQSRILRELL